MPPTRNKSSAPRTQAGRISLTCVLLSAVIAGCGAGATAAEAGGAGEDEPPRRPDGIAIDPTSAPPPAADEAAVSDGLVTLRTPLGVDVAIETVDSLFRRVAREDGEGVAALFTHDAIAITGAQAGNRQTPNAGLWWDRRFSRLDYGLLQGEAVYRADDVSIVRGKDLLEGSTPLRGATEASDSDGLDPSDLVVVVPIMTPRIGQVRLLGDEMVLFMRRVEGEYKIYRMLEEFSLQ